MSYSEPAALVFALALTACAPQLVCGDGTVEHGGACVAATGAATDGELRGRVVVPVEAGVAAAGIHVELADDPDLGDVTDDTGTFSIQGVPIGEHDVVAVATGADGSRYGVRVRVIVVGGEVVNMGDLTLARTGAVSGVVTLEGPSDHTGVLVYLPGTGFLALTNALGEFTILYIPAGTYSFRAERAGWEPFALAALEVFPSETTLLDPIALAASAGEPVCGNGVREAGEDCEGSDLGGVTCATLGHPSATLPACTATCVLDLAPCLALCGDAVVDASEVCDDGFADACGSCNADCSAPGAASSCGDGLWCPETEACDDGVDNSDEHHEPPRCDLACTGLGPHCGDGVANGPEVCDGADLGGASCASLGYASPDAPACTAACAFDPAPCLAHCGDGVLDAGEACDDGATDACGSCDAHCSGPGERDVAASAVYVERLSGSLVFENNDLIPVRANEPLFVVGSFADADVPIDARGNYWGPDITAEMEGGASNIGAIIDVHDDFNRAAVDYSEWRSEPVSP